MASDVSKAFGTALARARRAAKNGGKRVSQEKLAELSELDRTYISMLERGLRQPTLGTVFRLARALGVPATRLVREAERSYRRGVR